MKRSILVLLALLVTSPCFAADTKTSALTELATTPAGTDELYINDGGTSKKITYTNLISGAGDIVTIGDVTSGAAFNGTAGTKITGLTTSNLEIETANTLNFDTGADGNNFTIQSDGNVGIGTTGPTEQLHITDAIRAEGDSSAVSLYIPNAQAIRGEGNLYIDAKGAGSMYLRTTNSSTNRLFIQNDGNVGIATTAPTAKLHVIQTGAADAFRVDDQASDTTPFVIDQAGNVGIGVSAPSNHLHIANNDNLFVLLEGGADGSGQATLTLETGDGGVFSILRNDSSTYISSGDGSMNLQWATAQNATFFDGISSGSPILYVAGYDSGATAIKKGSLDVDAAGDFNISAHSGEVLRLRTAASDRVTVDNTGNVGIGTTAPTSILAIDKGTGYGQVTMDGSTGGCFMIRDTDDAGWTECSVLDGTMSCTTDGDGICDGS